MSKERSLTGIVGDLIPRNENPQLVPEIQFKSIDIKIPGLPDNFKGFKICHLSDLHDINVFFEKPELLEQIIQENPDLIVISGDTMHDANMRRVVPNLRLLKQSLPNTDMVIVTGNHEFMNRAHKKPDYKDKVHPAILSFQEQIKGLSIAFLRQDEMEIKRGEQSIFVLGIDDPYGYNDEDKYIEDQLVNSLAGIPINSLKVLVSHRPEKFDTYAKYQIDLVFSGHAHGGQIKLPFLGRGLIAPHQGIFANLIDGIYQQGNTQMIVSPGLSNEYKIPRFWNPGKIYFVSLQK